VIQISSTHTHTRTRAQLHGAVSAVPALTPDRIARGWSMIKFSGDSSHVVFGEIMEAIQISASDGATSLADFASGLTAANSAAWAAVGRTAVAASASFTLMAFFVFQGCFSVLEIQFTFWENPLVTEKKITAKFNIILLFFIFRIV
jgi:hypothetical protein